VVIANDVKNVLISSQGYHNGLAQVFMLALPPRLAVAWFRPDEINFVTAIAVSFNNLGIATGFALTPILVPSTKTMMTDIPRFMALQMGLCLIALAAIWFSFKKDPSQEYQRYICNCDI
jgi:predicted MFS family arabinose efflux permease